MIHAIQAFSVRPKFNNSFCSMSKAYKVLWVSTDDNYYAIRGSSGNLAYLGFSEATIETEVSNENPDNR